MTAPSALFLGAHQISPSFGYGGMMYPGPHPWPPVNPTSGLCLCSRLPCRLKRWGVAAKRVERDETDHFAVLHPSLRTSVVWLASLTTGISVVAPATATD